MDEAVQIFSSDFLGPPVIEFHQEGGAERLETCIDAGHWQRRLLAITSAGRETLTTEWLCQTLGCLQSQHQATDDFLFVTETTIETRALLVSC